MELTKEITTPMQGLKVVVKTILTGAEREQVDGAQMKYVKTTDGKTFDVIDMAKMTLAQKHELIKVSVVSIEGDETDTFARWHKMFETDSEYVYREIVEAQKKMTELTSPQS